MGKQIKKERQSHKKINHWQRTCERCGNEVISRWRKYKCPFCLWWNGCEEGEVR